MSQALLDATLLELTQQPGVDSGDAVRYTASLSQEARLVHRSADKNYSVTDILQASGRWLLAGDLMALSFAFFCGGLSAWAINMYLLRGGFQDLLALDTLKQTILFMGVGGFAVLWLDTHGHFRQRLPFWETTGHILKITITGFLVCGFVLAGSYGIDDRVHLVGFQANPLPFMHKAAALVMSSAFEGFGNVLVEALACGTPVVSTDCPYGPAEILESGRFGKLVPVGDKRALAEAILATLDNPLPREMLRARGYEFTVERSANDYLKLFGSLKV